MAISNVGLVRGRGGDHTVQVDAVAETLTAGLLTHLPGTMTVADSSLYSTVLCSRREICPHPLPVTVRAFTVLSPLLPMLPCRLLSLLAVSSVLVAFAHRFRFAVARTVTCHGVPSIRVTKGSNCCSGLVAPRSRSRRVPCAMHGGLVLCAAPHTVRHIRAPCAAFNVVSPSVLEAQRSRRHGPALTVTEEARVHHRQDGLGLQHRGGVEGVQLRVPNGPHHVVELVRIGRAATARTDG